MCSLFVIYLLFSILYLQIEYIFLKLFSPITVHLCKISYCFESFANRDKKIDEIIEYVHQNLEEAGRALATLGENFEHDLKVEPHIQLECHKTVSTSRRRKRRGYN